MNYLIDTAYVGQIGQGSIFYFPFVLAGGRKGILKKAKSAKPGLPEISAASRIPFGMVALISG